nr:MAG TPA: hypothetical protein [Caudoviricetes sp.]
MPKNANNFPTSRISILPSRPAARNNTPCEMVKNTGYIP